VSKFAAYIVGLVIFAAGAAFALDLAGVPGLWIVAAVLVVIGIGVAAGATRTKRDDPPQV
jgi:hypothetical protein